MLSVFFLLTFLFISVREANAQVVINEVLNNPSGDEAGAEWVEFYNLGTEVASLNGCVLYLDDNASSQKVVFGEEDFVDKFEVISWNDSWLNNSGDQVKLECASHTDFVSYGDQSGAVVSKPDDGISFGRSPDGTGSFYILNSVTLGEKNSVPPTSTPGPTNTPTPSPKPTNTPTPTAKPTVTSSPTPSPKPKVEGKKDEELSSDTGGKNTEETLGIQSSNNEVSPSPGPKEESEKKVPFWAGIFMVLGAVFVGVSLYPYIKTLRKRYNLDNGN